MLKRIFFVVENVTYVRDNEVSRELDATAAV